MSFLALEIPPPTGNKNLDLSQDLRDLDAFTEIKDVSF